MGAVDLFWVEARHLGVVFDDRLELGMARDVISWTVFHHD
jgi:hypothetical protein